MPSTPGAALFCSSRYASRSRSTVIWWKSAVNFAFLSCLALSRTRSSALDAVVAVLMGVYRLTKRQVPELMRDIFGLQMSVGAVIGCQKSASAAIAQPVEDARSYDNPQPVKHADETGWREGASRSRAWL